MSSDDDRRSAKARRRLAEEVAAAELVGRFMERELRSVRNELASLKDLFRLYGATPKEGQPLDTWIEEVQRKFTKAGGRMSRYSGRVSRLQHAQGGLLVEATLPGAVTVAALKRAERTAVNQNMDKSQRAAGLLLTGQEAPGGRVAVSLLVTDEAAAAKALQGVYPAVVVAVEDGEVDEISLVDSPAEFLSKGAAAAQVICKVFERGASNVRKPVPMYTKKYLKLQRKRAAAELEKLARGEALRKQAPAIPASAEAALAELKKAAEMSGDASLRRVCVERAQQAVGVEMIKAIQSRAPMSDPRMTLKIF
jgi:hypothetical protein